MSSAAFACGRAADDLAQSISESTETSARSHPAAGWRSRASGLAPPTACLVPELVGDRFLDRLDQGVELRLRDRLGRCRWRLRKAAARQSQQEDKYYRCP